MLYRFYVHYDIYDVMFSLEFRYLYTYTQCVYNHIYISYYLLSIRILNFTILSLQAFRYWRYLIIVMSSVHLLFCVFFIIIIIIIIIGNSNRTKNDFAVKLYVIIILYYIKKYYINYI